VFGPRLLATMAAQSLPRGVAGVLAEFLTGKRSRRECPPRFPVGKRCGQLALVGRVKQVGIAGSWSAFAGHNGGLILATWRSRSTSWIFILGSEAAGNARLVFQREDEMAKAPFWRCGDCCFR
jgi:hypothetical protein